MQRYESYKPSGAAWLGEIPSHWDTVPAKRLFREVSEKNHPTAELLSVTQEQGVLPRDQLEQRVVMPTGQLQTFKLVRSDDFVISLRSFQGGIEYSAYTGLVSPAYTVLRRQKQANSRYLKHLFKSRSFISELNTSVTGIREGKNISFSEMSYSLLPIPEENEQKKIADILDLKTAEIDAAIAKKERLIELLDEQKYIAINNAVTRGLNQASPVQATDVQWIGAVPSHWSVSRAKFLFREIDERSETGNEELLSVSHMTGVTPRSEKTNIYMFMAEDYAGSKLCKPNDLVFNIMWAWMGALGVSERTGIVSPSYGVYRQRREGAFNNWYLENLLRSSAYVAEYNRRSTGLHSSRLRLYSHMFFDMEIAVPPREEQNEIERTTKARIEKTDAVISATRKEVEKLTEFRATLVDSLVTGKIKA